MEEYKMNGLEIRRYCDKFNIGQIVRIAETNHIFLIHVGFGRLMYFYLSNPRLKVGDFIVFDYIKDGEVEYVDTLDNYKYLDSIRVYPWEGQDSIDKASLPQKCICLDNRFSGFSYGARSFVILDGAKSYEKSKFKRMLPSFESHLLLNSLFADSIPNTDLDDTFLSNIIKWATEIVDNYNLEEALNSVRVFTRSSSIGVCHDHNGEYVTDEYFDLEYLHHNKLSSYYDCHSVHDPYLEKVIFPDLDIHLRHTDDRNPEEDWINPQYPNPNTWEEDAIKIEDEIRNKARTTYNRFEHIGSLVNTKLRTQIKTTRGKERIVEKNKKLAAICWGLYVFKDEKVIDYSTICRYNKLFDQPEDKHLYVGEKLVSLDSNNIYSILKTNEKTSEKMRKTILSDYLKIDFE